MKDKIYNIEGDWWWPKADDGCWAYMKSHEDVPKLVSNFVDKKRVVVQAGGNCGFYVKQYSSIFETVYTFEPDVVNFFCLNLNVTEQNVIKIQSCLGDKYETVGLNNFMTDVGATHVSGQGIVPTFKIDDLNLVCCDLIHLDVEGYELKALNGAVETIKKFRPVIAFEFHDAWAERYGYGMNELTDFFNQFNYQSVGEVHGDRVYKVAE